MLVKGQMKKGLERAGPTARTQHIAWVPQKTCAVVVEMIDSTKQIGDFHAMSSSDRSLDVYEYFRRFGVAALSSRLDARLHSENAANTMAVTLASSDDIIRLSSGQQKLHARWNSRTPLLPSSSIFAKVSLWSESWADFIFPRRG